MIFHLGPLELYRVDDQSILNIGLKAFPNAAFGWQYGWRDYMRGVDKPVIEVRIGKLMILYFQKFKQGFELHFLGFWWVK